MAATTHARRGGFTRSWCSLSPTSFLRSSGGCSHQFLRDEFRAGATDCSERPCAARTASGLQPGPTQSGCHPRDLLRCLSRDQQPEGAATGAKCRQDVELVALALLVFGAEGDLHEKGAKKTHPPLACHPPGDPRRPTRVGRPSRGVSPQARTGSPHSGQRHHDQAGSSVPYPRGPRLPYHRTHGRLERIPS